MQARPNLVRVASHAGKERVATSWCTRLAAALITRQPLGRENQHQNVATRRPSMTTVLTVSPVGGFPWTSHSGNPVSPSRFIAWDKAATSSAVAGRRSSMPFVVKRRFTSSTQVCGCRRERGPRFVGAQASLDGTAFGFRRRLRRFVCVWRVRCVRRTKTGAALAVVRQNPARRGLRV